MKPEILVLVPIYAPTLAALEREYVVRKLWLERDAVAYLRNSCGNVRGVVTTGLAGCSREVVEALPRLEIIASFGSPRRNTAFDLAAERGIVVTNTPDSITDSVADLAVGLLLAVMRRICEGERFLRAGKWTEGPFPPGRELGGKVCGIVGLGAIGRAVAKRVEAFGMSVCYHGPRRKADVAWPFHAGLEDLARVSDCLVVTCPSTPETRGMVNARILEALGPDGFLVNVARGAIVDERALIAALRGKGIAGAALDVFWDEPRVPAELTGLDNVVLLPHIGSTTREIREGRGNKVLENLRARFAGRPVPYPVTQPHKLD
jgi:lactate dehydrogenase-like 2-hydroxyacid dehydrogenase